MCVYGAVCGSVYAVVCKHNLSCSCRNRCSDCAVAGIFAEKENQRRVEGRYHSRSIFAGVMLAPMDRGQNDDTAQHSQQPSQITQQEESTPPSRGIPTEAESKKPESESPVVSLPVVESDDPGETESPKQSNDPAPSKSSEPTEPAKESSEPESQSPAVSEPVETPDASPPQPESQTPSASVSPSVSPSPSPVISPSESQSQPESQAPTQTPSVAPSQPAETPEVYQPQPSINPQVVSGGDRASKFANGMVLATTESNNNNDPVYHTKNCRSAQKIATGSEMWYNSAQDAINAGRRLCGNCKR